MFCFRLKAILVRMYIFLAVEYQRDSQSLM